VPHGAEPEIAQEELAPRDSELRTAYVAPQSDLEEILTTVWQDFFGIGKVGTLDNFFDLGGDSLSGARMISHVRSLFRTDLPPNTLFNAPTIAKLAAYMISRESRPGITEKTAALMKRIKGMSKEEVSLTLKATTAVA
jgi:acyl carrier protein